MDNLSYKLEITNLIPLLFKGLKLLNDKAKSFQKLGLESYLQNQMEKFYFVNTFIHRGNKVRFDDVYYPISVEYNELVTKFEKLNEVLEEYKYITIIGGAGSGKSTLIKYIFLNSIRQAYKIPVLIELRHLNNDPGSLKEFIFEKLLSNELEPSRKILERTIKKGAFLFLLDGFDEVLSSKKEKITMEIDDLIDVFPKNKYVLTTRPGTGIEASNRFHQFKVLDLTPDEINEFIDLMIDVEERNKQIKLSINEINLNTYTEYLKNPLLLSMFILSFENHPEIPSKMSAFYKNVFDTLYSKHDGWTKASFKRERRTNLDREDFENILSIFSFISFWEGDYTFTEELLTKYLLKVKNTSERYNFKPEDIIYDLRTTVSILILDGFEYKFPHRSMQEYFAALFLSSVSSQKKQIIYENIITGKNSGDLYYNFIQLCQELDEIEYLQYFIKPLLKKVLKTFENCNDYELFNAYIKMHNTKIIAGKKTSEGIGVAIILNSISFIGMVLESVGITPEHGILEFPNINDVINDINKYIKENPTTIKRLFRDKESLYYLQKNIDIKQIFIKHGISDVIKKHIKKIEEKLTEINNLIKKQDTFIDDILS